MFPRTVRILLGTAAVAATLVTATLPLGAQPVYKPPVPKVAPPVQETIDLTTPVAALRSFGAAVNRSDFVQAAQCVADANTGNAEQFAALADQLRKINAQVAVSEPTVRIQGDMALASFFSQAKLNLGPNKAAMEQPVLPERVLLRLSAGQWKVVSNVALLTRPGQQAAPVPAPGLEQGNGFFTFIASHLANPDIIKKTVREAQEAACVNNLKQLAIAAKQLILAFGGVLAFTQAAPNPADINAAKVPALPALLEKPWQKALWAYTLMPQIFFCPLRLEIKPGDEAAATERARRDKLTDRAKMLRVGEAYSLNEIIDGLKLNTIPKPGETVLFYEGSDGKLDFRHDGKANVAFCDGHVIAVSPADAKKLIWNPLAPDALIEAGK